MGIGTVVKESSPQGPSRFLRGFDMPLLVIVVALMVFGLVMLYSASWDFSRAAYDGDAMYMFNRQVMWLGLGMLAAIALAFVDYHRWRQLIVPAMALTVLMLVVVLVMSEIRFNARRTIFNGSIQPSELAKLVSILYIAVWLYAKRDMLKDITFGLIPLGVILGFIGGLIYLQPDLSAAATVLMLGGLLFFLAGGDLKQIGGLLIIAVVVAWLVVSVSLTGQQRVSDFVAGIKDPLQASYHVRRSFEAIVNGGWFGGVGLIGMFAALIWRGLVIARRAPDMLGTLLASGLVIWIGLEALINMAVMVGLLPFAGNALPFVSAGGSNLVTTLAALGILFNISRQGSSSNDTNDEWRSYGAVVNLRWWNGRGRVSRTSRLRSAKE